MSGHGAVRPGEQGADFCKGRRRPHHGDEGLLLVEALIEADEEDLDELFVLNGIAEFTEFIGDGLEALAVYPHGRVALGGVPKLHVERVDTGVDVVLKKLAEGCPKGGGAGGSPEDEIKNLGAHPLVDPLYHSEIILDPAGIRGRRRDAEVDVRHEIAATQVHLKKMPPMVVVVFGEI